MLVDIVNAGWAPVYLVNLTEDVPGYIESGTTALSYGWKHLISGHLGRLATREDVSLHQQYLAEAPRVRCRQHGVVVAGCPEAVRCMDPFHVVASATTALDQVRREVRNQARRGGQVRHASDLKGARWALWKNPQHLTRDQQAKLAWIQRTNRRLYRAYLLKEQLREVFRSPSRTPSCCSTGGWRGPSAHGWRPSSRWLGWSSTRCRG